MQMTNNFYNHLQTNDNRNAYYHNGPISQSNNKNMNAFPDFNNLNYANEGMMNMNLMNNSMTGMTLNNPKKKNFSEGNLSKHNKEKNNKKPNNSKMSFFFYKKKIDEENENTEISMNNNNTHSNLQNFIENLNQELHVYICTIQGSK